MPFYPKTVALLKYQLTHVYGGVYPERNKTCIPNHLLWMLLELENNSERFPDTRKGSARAGRWIGWIFAQIEDRGLIREARYLKELKEDVENGNF